MPHVDKDVHRDLVQLKRKLGLNQRSSLPLCPGYSRNTANRLDYLAGKTIHKKKGHVCVQCQCKKVAGWGTAHYGWGLCQFHEKWMSEKEKERVSESHLKAIRERSPFVYRDASAWEKEVRKTGEKSRIQIDLTNELEIARGLVQEIVDKCSGDERGRAQLVELCEDWKHEDPDNEDVIARLDAIILLLSTPTSVTEYQGGKLVKASDKTRYELTSKLLYNVGRIGLDQWTVNRHEVITKEAYYDWLAKLSGICRRRIPNDKDWADFIIDLKQIGDPTTKTV